MSSHLISARPAGPAAGGVVGLFRNIALFALILMVLPATARADVVTYWNEVATNAIVKTRKSAGLSLAIMHAAIYDAVNAIDGRYSVYAVTPTSPTRGASPEAAAAAAAYYVLVGLFPTEQATLDAAYSASLATIPDGEAKARGIALGAEAAEAILALRANDGREANVPYTVGSGPGVYQLTPPAFAPPATPWLAQVLPFTLRSPSQFRPDGPPPLDSEQYAADFDEVKRLGALNSAERTPEQTEIGRFHTESPTTFWSRNFRQFADSRGLSVADSARLFVLLSIAWADASIAGWDAKYHFNFWRPVTAIRAAETDGNPATEADPSWTPLAATPAHPEYPAAHGFTVGAFAEVLRHFFGTKRVTITFTSTVTNTAHTFTSTDDLVKEVIEARIYGGMHYRTSAVHGVVLGKKVGRWITKHYFRPLERSRRASRAQALQQRRLAH